MLATNSGDMPCSVAVCLVLIDEELTVMSAKIRSVGPLLVSLAVILAVAVGPAGLAVAGSSEPPAPSRPSPKARRRRSTSTSTAPRPTTTSCCAGARRL